MTEKGEVLTEFNVLDGLGIKLLRKSGLEIAVISGRKLASVKLRLEDLGVTTIYQGIKDKLMPYEDLKQELQLCDAEVAMMGDDIPDLPILARCGLGIAPLNATQLIKDTVDYVTFKSGGEGAVREFCDLLMEAQGTLNKQLKDFLK